MFFSFSFASPFPFSSLRLLPRFCFCSGFLFIGFSPVPRPRNQDSTPWLGFGTVAFGALPPARHLSNTRRKKKQDRLRERVCLLPSLVRCLRLLAPNKRTRLKDTRQAYRHGKQEHFTTTILAECKTCLKGDIKNECPSVSGRVYSSPHPPPSIGSIFFSFLSFLAASLLLLPLVFRFLFRSVGRAKRSCLRKEEAFLPCAGNGTTWKLV